MPPGQILSHLLLGISTLATGLALVVHILSGIPLPMALAETLVFAALAALLIWRRLPSSMRMNLLLVARAGVSAGLIATVAYDGARFALSRWDPSPYNPFETLRIFGALLLGPDAAPFALYGTGTVFHVVNGVTFGLGYTALLGSRGMLIGMIWGLGLEFFQLALYPDWLGIQFIREFARISAASHLIYGATLGACARYALAAIGGRDLRAIWRELVT